MPEHILLTTDFSDESYRAFEPVARLARKLQARITLVHVVPDLKAIPYGAILAPPQSSPELPEHVERAREHLAEVRKRLPDDLEVRIEVLTDEYVEKAVARYAEENGVDYIAMSTHGRSNLRRLFMGSVTRAVLSESTTPVIVYPKT